MEKRGLGKRAELTTQQLVMIIVLIASFVIILFLLYRLNLGQTTDAEICHNSVVLQGQPHLQSGALDCKTNYLCVSGGNKCSNIIQTDSVSIDTSKPLAVVKNETFKALADEMANCWWEFGEGKIDYAQAGITQKVSCSVCSLTSFDDKVLKSLGGTITYKEFYSYLRTTPKTASQTYLQYLYGVNTLTGMENLVSSKDYLNNTFDFSKTYFILTGVVQEGYLSSFSGAYHILPFTGNTKAAPYPVVILEKTQDNYNKVGCSEFLTKA